MSIEHFNINIKNGSWWFDDNRSDYNSLEKLKEIIEKIDFVVRNIDELKYHHKFGNSYSSKPRWMLLTGLGMITLLIASDDFRDRSKDYLQYNPKVGNSYSCKLQWKLLNLLRDMSLVFGSAYRQRMSECDLLTREIHHDQDKETLEKVDGISAMILLYGKIRTLISKDLSEDFFVGKNEVLNLAAMYGELDVSEFLVEHGADVNSKAGGLSVLETAALTGHARIVKFLLENQAQMHPNSEGRTPLMLASTAEITQILLKAGGRVTINNFTTIDKGEPMSALHRAAFKGNLEQIKLLCVYGANILARDPAGRTALFWASKGNREDAVRLLIENGANVLHGDTRTGETPLIVTQSAKITQQLLDAVAKEDIDHSTLSLSAALHSAIDRRNYEKVKVLIQNGANIREKNRNGETALDSARKQLYADVKYRVQRGIKVPDTDENSDLKKLVKINTLLRSHW